MKRFASALLALTLLFPSAASAATAVGEQECLTDIANAMAKEQRLYRAVLFGRTTAADAPLGDVRYSEDGPTMYVKMGEGRWEAAVQGASTLNNGQMDAQQEKDVLCNTGAPSCVTTPRKGVFAVKGALASDVNILPAILQAQRALLYRTLAVCDVAEQSMSDKVPTPVKAQIVGGWEMSMKPFAGCMFAGKDEWQGARLTVTERCGQIADALVLRERQLLELLVAYDGGVRSLYQMSGGFDNFLAGWRTTLTGPLWGVVRVMRWLPKIPCFLSVCSE